VRSVKPTCRLSSIGFLVSPVLTACGRSCSVQPSPAPSSSPRCSRECGDETSKCPILVSAGLCGDERGQRPGGQGDPALSFRLGSLVSPTGRRPDRAAARPVSAAIMASKASSDRAHRSACCPVQPWGSRQQRSRRPRVPCDSRRPCTPGGAGPSTSAMPGRPPQRCLRRPGRPDALSRQPSQQAGGSHGVRPIRSAATLSGVSPVTSCTARSVAR